MEHSEIRLVQPHRPTLSTAYEFYDSDFYRLNLLCNTFNGLCIIFPSNQNPWHNLEFAISIIIIIMPVIKLISSIFMMCLILIQSFVPGSELWLSPSYFANTVLHAKVFCYTYILILCFKLYQQNQLGTLEDLLIIINDAKITLL